MRTKSFQIMVLAGIGFLALFFNNCSEVAFREANSGIVNKIDTGVVVDTTEIDGLEITPDNEQNVKELIEDLAYDQIENDPDARPPGPKNPNPSMDDDHEPISSNGDDDDGNQPISSSDDDDDESNQPVSSSDDDDDESNQPVSSSDDDDDDNDQDLLEVCKNKGKSDKGGEPISSKIKGIDRQVAQAKVPFCTKNGKTICPSIRAMYGQGQAGHTVGPCKD